MTSKPSQRLAELRADASLDDVIAVIERDGGVIVEDFVDAAILRELKADLLPAVEACSTGRDDFSGVNTRRMSALFAKTRRIADVVTHPLLLGASEHFVNSPIVYGCGEHARSVRPGLRIGATQLIQIAPGQEAQPLHRDHWALLWRYPDYGRQVRVQVMVAVSDFTEENGATRVVPGSHLWSEDRVADPCQAVPAEMAAGSALLFLGSTHHGGGANRTSDQFRSGLTTGLDSAAVRQEENMYLALSAEVVRSYPEQIQRLLGWSYMPETYTGWVEIDGEMADPNRLLR
ncbi:MAG TPA: phytanoyl-CoA dioxygenase family protein [Candidatus Binatia bacterium]|nr:phytanoyl-CoA dioxygenase family protein [Candidatus Binatia bacterium]